MRKKICSFCIKNFKVRGVVVKLAGGVNVALNYKKTCSFMLDEPSNGILVFAKYLCWVQKRGDL